MGRPRRRDNGECPRAGLELWSDSVEACVTACSVAPTACVSGGSDVGAGVSCRMIMDLAFL